jgi:alpha-tubulin suppressor-like RCC1 family protein
MAHRPKRFSKKTNQFTDPPVLPTASSEEASSLRVLKNGTTVATDVTSVNINTNGAVTHAPAGRVNIDIYNPTLYSVTFPIPGLVTGSPYLWGRNNVGQLGANYPSNASAPAVLAAISAAVQVSACGYHTAVKMPDGSIWAWGDNFSGQLGVGDHTDRHVPTRVLGPGGVGFLSGVAKIVCGQNHTLFVMDDGSLYACGNNGAGSLGLNSTSESVYPVQVHGVGNVGFLAGIVDAAAGADTSFAWTEDGTCYGWGEGLLGAHGHGDTTDRLVPVAISGLPGPVSQVAASTDRTTIFLLTDGTVRSVGNNNQGNLGIDSTTNQTAIQQVKGVGGTGVLEEVTAIATQGSFVLALLTDQTLVAWGGNSVGQCAQNDTTTPQKVPVVVKGVGGTGTLSGITMIGTSYSAGYAYSTTTGLYGWGGNNHSQVGNGGGADVLAPVAIGPVPDVMEISGGTYHVIVLGDETAPTATMASSSDIILAQKNEDGTDNPIIQGNSAIEVNGAQGGRVTQSGDRKSMISWADATTSVKGVTQLAAHGESVAGRPLQSDDPRVLALDPVQAYLERDFWR